MTKQRQRKSLNCEQLYSPDPRNLRHQRYCSALAVRKASKAASQARWLSKPQNRNYFRGPEKDYNFKPVVLMLFHAVDSSMCTRDTETKQTFAGDLLNLTLAASDINSAKGSLDAFGWLPDKNQCWFAQRIVDVKLKYEMAVDKDEADALEGVLSGCESTDLIKESCAQ